MNRSSWAALFTTGLLWSAAGLADDVQDSKTGDELLPVVTLSVETMFAELAIPARWRLIHPPEATAYSVGLVQPITDFNFQDADALSRLSEIRGLSLFTFAEIRQTRLFLGVNEKGLVGLHFDLSPNYGGERYLEVFRMPYLKETSPEEE